jgi:hypothetical protein
MKGPKPNLESSRHSTCLCGNSSLRFVRILFTNSFFNASFSKSCRYLRRFDTVLPLATLQGSILMYCHSEVSMKLFLC